MFKIKRKNKMPADAQVQQLEKAIRTWKITAEFFQELGPINLRPGENAMDLVARCLGITRQAFEDAMRYQRSIAAGRVIPRGE